MKYLSSHHPLLHCAELTYRYETHTHTIQLSNTCRAYSILIVKQLYKKRSFNKKQYFYAVTPSLVTSNGCGTSMAPL